MRNTRTRKALLAAAAGISLLVGGEAMAIIGRPATPMSFAGVARRTAYRGVAYAGTAAVVGAAAVTATAVTAGAIASLPYGCRVGVPCSGVVYQPVYQGSEVVYVPEDELDEND